MTLSPRWCLSTRVPSPAGIAKILFVVFLVMAVVSFFAGRRPVI